MQGHDGGSVRCLLRPTRAIQTIFRTYRGQTHIRIPAGFAALYRLLVLLVDGVPREGCFFFFFWEIPTGWQTFTFTLLLGKVGNAMAGGFYHHVCHVDTMDGCIGLPSVIGLPPLLMSLCFLLEGQKRRRKNPSPVSLESLEAFQEILFLLYGVYAVTTS